VLWKHNSNNQSNAQMFTRQSTEIPLAGTENKRNARSILHTSGSSLQCHKIHPLRGRFTFYCAFLHLMDIV